jgi:hypothetical protein
VLKSPLTLATRSGERSMTKRRTHAQFMWSLINYCYLGAGGVMSTCPSFTGSVAPGLKDVRTTPSLPSRRYATS